jgi:hypothetical protein
MSYLVSYDVASAVETKPMASWRANTSEATQQDLDGLLNTALGFAEQELRQRGEFHPFALAITVEGESVMVAPDPRPAPGADSSSVLSTTKDTVRKDRASLRAVAVTADIRPKSGDAVQVELEHVEGPALTVHLPYQLKRRRRQLALGELTASGSSRQFWTGST